jgi:hypothetical protein
MQFEEFNKKIREAAEQHHPAYDEEAWKKMEKLLRKHLPAEEKERRRIVFFILFFLLLGGGVFVAINKPWQKNTTSAIQPPVTLPADNKQQSKSQQINSPVQPDHEGGQQSNPGTVLSKENRQPQQLSIDNANPQKSLVDFELNSGQKNINEEKAVAKQNSPLVSIGKDPSNNEVKKDEKIISNGQLTDKNSEISATTANIPNNVAVPKNNESNQMAVGENKNENSKSLATAAQKNKTEGKKFLDGFAFNLSGGPDLSKAGNSRVGKTTFAFGGGISYTWKNFTLRSGVYSAEKIYSAGEDDYKLNYALPQNIKFEGADAKCRVTEIPFSLAYDFASKNNHSWFAGAGLSSYLMNKEDYTYWYTNYSSGSYYSRDFEIRNQNKHYFSVINLSAGYTRQLSKFISITAEPYVKIPFQGIGLGSVHLNSGGILFSVGIQPFNNNKKKK